VNEENLKLVIEGLKTTVKSSLDNRPYSATYDRYGRSIADAIIAKLQTLIDQLSWRVPDAVKLGIVESAKLHKKDVRSEIYEKVYLDCVLKGTHSTYMAMQHAKEVANQFIPYDKLEQ